MAVIQIRDERISKHVAQRRPEASRARAQSGAARRTSLDGRFAVPIGRGALSTRPFAFPGQCSDPAKTRTLTGIGAVKKSLGMSGA